MKKQTKYITYLIMMLLVSKTAVSQRICDYTKEHVNLSNGVSVDIFKERGSNTYYYVPNQLRLSTKKGKPEYSFQEYKENEKAAPSGAILHCLVTWGITTEQLNELRLYVKNKHGDKAVVAGAITMEPKSQEVEFSHTIIGYILKHSLKSRGTLSTLSNSKTALSFHIKKSDVVVIRDAIKNPNKLKKTTITLHYKYNSYTCNSGVSQMYNNETKIIGQLQKWF
ncbi:hypothetical protein [Flavivirga spongiicola]|uniref:DUF4468 domain-containing protein n=1 Tax=Flavivirga spongiicola TaxID=421621 RepID=A0ABU7XM33_9FLAO|nr:hypothetical protein [Flavivirga sp. MEBiC05379]MDO5981474.1 hypothetical protein [Flavivirga sp. MEBiC05379]